MKKVILLLSIAFSISFGVSAMSLKDAFEALSNVPNISAKTDYDTPIGVDCKWSTSLGKELGRITNFRIRQCRSYNS